MNNYEQYVNIKDIGKVLLEYIGSEDYLKAVDSIQDSGKAAFMGGLGMAGCLIFARCPKHLGSIEEVEKESEVSKEPIVCKSYHAEKNFLGKVGVCYGTKEKEPCSCKGDKNKCDYYGG